jgi:ATP-dependent Clp protease ATP-binding subunit ClpA
VDPRVSKSVLRYFLPADSFLRIFVREASVLAARARAGLSHAAYRRLVIECCCPELGTDVRTALARLCPEDPASGEELLYQLCIEVNPELDIHSVRLAGEPQPAPATARGDDPRASLERLARAAKGLERRLARCVVGQDAAITCCARAVRRAAAGLTAGARPRATLFFVGRTGTGKTELARALANELFDGSLVRVDCSEYAMAHEYSKLLGAPPGYVGHDQAGFLAESMKKKPESVVLFDEIEKAHPKLHSLLLQLIDEGHLSDGRAKRIDFTRALVVMTSNAGSAEIQAAGKRVGFARGSSLAPAHLAEIVGEALQQGFAPEFLGRLDERVLFRELDESDATEIAALQLAALAARCRQRGFPVAFPASVARWVARRGFDPLSGAREIRRVVQREVEAPLAERLLAERAGRRGLLRACVRADRLSFRAA